MPPRDEEGSMRGPAEPREMAGASPSQTTHDVLNQSGELDDYDAFAADLPLVEAVRQFGAGWADEDLRRAGALVGSERVRHLARQANRIPPELRTHDRFG